MPIRSHSKNVELIASLPDGTSAWRLLTETAYHKALKEVIGDAPVYKGFDRGVEHVALRGGDSKTSVVVVCGDNAVLRGHGIGGDPRLGAIVRAFAKETGREVQIPETQLGFVTDVAGVEYSLDALPETLSVPGDLSLFYLQWISRWPRRIHVAGRCQMLGISPEVEELVVGKDLRFDVDFHGAVLVRLPRRTHVGDTFYAENSDLCELPPDFRAGGSVFLSGTKIPNLPDGLRVDGDLGVSRTPLTHLPAGLIVTENMSARFLDLEGVPDDIQVGGELNLEGSSIRRLPDGLRCGSLDVSETRHLEELPRKLVVDGDLIAKDSAVRTVHADMVIGGCIDLSGTEVATLPEGLKAGGDLILSHCHRLTSLPDHMEAGGKIDLRYTHIKRDQIGPGITSGMPTYLNDWSASRGRKATRRTSGFISILRRFLCGPGR